MAQLHRRPELSQHFFRDQAFVHRWVGSLPLRADLPVMEIGAGTGIITEALAARGLRVIAIERDARLFRALRARFIGRTNVEAHHADFMRFPLPRTPYSVVANLPFGITAAVMHRLLDAPAPPADAFLVLQREAAEKFAGAPRETMFSLLHKPVFSIEVGRAFRRADFDPPPRVATAMLHVRRRPAPLISRASMPLYRAFTREAFGAASLRPWLSRGQRRRLETAHGIGRDALPSHLTFGQWLTVFRFVEHECLGHDPCGNGVQRVSREPGRWRLEDGLGTRQHKVGRSGGLDSSQRSE